MQATIGLIFLLLLPVASSLGAASWPPSAIDGVWITERESEITITPCETGHCGYLSKIVIPPEIYATNKDAIDQIGVGNLVDYNNKDPNLRTRPMLGLQILNLNKPLPRGAFEGEVYNPEDGNSYYGKLELVSPDRIRLTGCALFNLVCKSEDWVRAQEPITGAIDPPGTFRWQGPPGTETDQPLPSPLANGAVEALTPAQ